MISRIFVRAQTLVPIFAADRTKFVVVNLVVNLATLVRSYITMQVLDFRELGLAAVLQSIVLLLGALQFGMLNGGYRLLCEAGHEEAARVRNLLYTFLGLACIVGFVLVGISLPFISGWEADIVALLGVVGGVATLGRTWMMNQLIAKGSLQLLNRVNFLSGIGSLMLMVFVLVDPLIACLAAVVAQPILFMLLAGLLDPTLLPNRIERSRALIGSVLRTGFLVFLTGIFLQLNLQIERWYVTAFLGLDALGHLYLALLFVTLFQLVPTSLDQVFLPPLVRAHSGGDREGLVRTMRQFMLVTIGYCAVAAFAVLVLAEPVTAILLPEYVPDLRYIYLLAPGLILFTLSAPLSVIFNVLVRYRTYLVAYGTGSAVTAAIFLVGVMPGWRLGLDQVVLVRSAIYALMAVLLGTGYWLLSRHYRGFRFRNAIE